MVGNGAAFIDRPIREQLLVIHSQMLSLRQSNEDIQCSIQEHQAQQTRQYQTLNSNIRRIAIVPASRVVVGDQAGNGNGQNVPNTPVATLSATPRDLYILWQEYTVGIAGRKAARMFSAAERGQVKHKFTRRKVVWQTIDYLVLRGLQANGAIDWIYEVYGHENSVTNIISQN